jgi:3-hydroxyacyl-[acyl-carrier-protein] dehydratase
MKNITAKILEALPYGREFCFVDSIEYVDDKKIIGHYTFKEDLFFYNSHFKSIPYVPGVLILETMGQIGMVSHLIFLLNDYKFNFLPILSYIEVEFFNSPQYNHQVKVIGEKIYFRHNILKSKVEMYDSENNLISKSITNIKALPR